MEWKLLEMLFGRYEVSDTGLVRNSKTKKNLHLTHNKCGYTYVSLTVKQKVYCKRVHRMVATAFKENPFSYKDVNHINGIKTDNRAENLEWCTRKYNLEHNAKIGIFNRRNHGQRKPYKGNTEYSLGHREYIKNRRPEISSF